MQEGVVQNARTTKGVIFENNAAITCINLMEQIANSMAHVMYLVQYIANLFK